VVVLAQEEARGLRHSYIGTEHILLGLLREEEQQPDGERPLEALGITVVDARKRVAEIVSAGEEPTGGQIPFTPRAKKVLELSLREALNFGHNWIRPAHLLLGLLRENEGVATQVLIAFDVDTETLRGRVSRVLARLPNEPPAVVLQSVGRRVPTDTAWFERIAEVLPTLGSEIRERLGREPDLGDLLLTTVCARPTLAGEALDELGIDLNAVWGTLERVRQAQIEKREELERTIAQLEDKKQRALEDGRFEEAARLRDEQRELAQRRRSPSRRELLREVRARLGLPAPED
jgi:ATP-dependent Clp protease ATP-binding subunit ClpA